MAAVAAGVALAIGPATASASAAQKPKPVGIDWSNRHFSNPVLFRGWLSKRGVDYELWLRRHPRGGYLLTHAPRPHIAPGPIPVPPAARSSAPSGGPRWLYVLALAMLVVALVPSRLFARILPEHRSEHLAPARTALAAAAVSLALGALIASLF